MNNAMNTERGTKAERLLRDTLPKNRTALNLVLESQGMHGAVVLNAEVIGGQHRKGDVRFDLDGEHPPLRFNVKSFGRMGFNQLGRQKFIQFCAYNRISKSDQQFLEGLWLRKATSAVRTQNLVEQNERDRVTKIFESIEPAASSFLGSDHPELLALYSRDEGLWKIYDINKQVRPLIRSKKVGFTSGTSNIMVGEYVVIQRKGSKKESPKLDISNLLHGANDVQIKMLTKKFFEEQEPLAYY